ncbi:hypothetical protein LPA44_07335 [Halobacterium sp. KA-4]|uniref:hypothetical protein n=1 Tax=Halobacterium sp. KA-4 TaxID=2896367 RepID=UPI001E4CC38A|nr:hypothetical protein [Halobacterium sp. KA-4]MCD2199708.1 hypothetical protein [Halobacterium sp. KA-4]
MHADGVHERLSGGQCVVQRVAELGGVLAGEKQFFVADGDGDPAAAALDGEIRRAVGFLDQPRRRGLLYPRLPASSDSDSASWETVAGTRS